MTYKHNQHLGDGVYASFDGYHVWLAANHRGNRSLIALEPSVLDNLHGYIASLIAGEIEE